MPPSAVISGTVPSSGHRACSPVGSALRRQAPLSVPLGVVTGWCSKSAVTHRRPPESVVWPASLASSAPSCFINPGCRCLYRNKTVLCGFEHLHRGGVRIAIFLSDRTYMMAHDGSDRRGAFGDTPSAQVGGGLGGGQGPRDTDGLSLGLLMELAEGAGCKVWVGFGKRRGRGAAVQLAPRLPPSSA